MGDGWIPADWDAPPGIVAGTTLRGGGLEALELPGRPCHLNQVHGNRVVPAGHYPAPPDADASTARDPGWVCVVRTADCLPVLFCADDGAEIAAAHAGWRGLAAGILEHTVAAMATGPGQLHAWIGPAITQPAFEVGAEVRAAFVDADAEAAVHFAPNRRGRWQADLPGLARQRLARLGITRVSGGTLCTFGDPDRFYSYRRDGQTGRLYSFVAMLASP